MLSMLRQPRYAAFSALMVIVAVACCLAGTWQIYRYIGKHDANHALRANDHATPVSVDSVLPLVGGLPPREDAVEYRSVRVTGTYDSVHQSLVRHRSVGTINPDDGTGTTMTGSLVVTPLRTTQGRDLLVVRGFVIDGTPIAQVAAPPAGPVTVLARVLPSEKPSDRARDFTGQQVDSINATDQAARLGTPTYDGFAELLPGQPGSAGLVALGGPDLSNPAGGAIEPQHLAYVVQWYLFALLALAAPLVMARSESRRDAPETLDTLDTPDTPDSGGSRVGAGAPVVAEPAMEDALADRYGRPRRTRVSGRRAL